MNLIFHLFALQSCCNHVNVLAVALIKGLQFHSIHCIRPLKHPRAHAHTQLNTHVPTSKVLGIPFNRFQLVGGDLQRGAQINWSVPWPKFEAHWPKQQ